MDLTKRLGLSQDLLNIATNVLEGKKIVHPNQKAISAAAPPEDEITAADFKALKAKKKHRVEGFDRNKKRFESPLFETYEEAAAFFNKLRKSSPLTNLQIVSIEEKVSDKILIAKSKLSKPDMIAKTGKFDAASKEMDDIGTEIKAKNQNSNVPAVDIIPDKNTNNTSKDNKEKEVGYSSASQDKEDNAVVIKKKKSTDTTLTDIEESAELNTANANDARSHDCAKHVVHEQWGVGETVPTMHAEPDADGKIAWYDVMFEHGIEHQVATSDLEITLSETHVHKKSKRMSEQEQHGKTAPEKKASSKNTQVVFNPDHSKDKVNSVRTEEVESVDEKTLTPAEMKKREEVAKAIKREHPGMPMGMKMAIATKVAKKVAEGIELDEGRKSGTVGALLSNPTAREHFKKLTGKEPSYFHITKNPDHAKTALDYAAKAKSGEGESSAPAGDEDTEASKHPINQLRGIADRGKGKFMGKDISSGHANKLLAMHDALKPAQKVDFVSNIGKHLAKVMS